METNRISGHVPEGKVRELQQNLGHCETWLLEIFPLQLRNVLKEKLWLQCVDKNGDLFTNFEAFVVHRLPQGLETTIEDLLTVCRMSARRSTRRHTADCGTEVLQLIKDEIAGKVNS